LGAVFKPFAMKYSSSTDEDATSRQTLIAIPHISAAWRLALSYLQATGEQH
jgi:hypothetical protein